MRKSSTIAALVTATLAGMAAESAWPHEATPDGTAAHAENTPARRSRPVTGWYPPPPHPNVGDYAQSRQQQPYRPARPQGYSQAQPSYPPQGRYRDMSTAPAAMVNSLSAELKYTQEQLATKSEELSRLHATLEQLRAILQHRLEAEITLSEKVAAITSEQLDMQARVKELTVELNTATAALEQHRQQIADRRKMALELTAERDRLRDELVSRSEQLAVLQAELQTTLQTLKQAETFRIGQAGLQAQLADQKTGRQNAEQALAHVIAERDDLKTDLAARSEHLARTRTALAAAQSEIDTLRQVNSEAAAVVTAPGAEINEEPEVAVVEIAALQTIAPDTDGDGIPDSADLCHETPQHIAVDVTGCVDGAAINLEGVNFLYDSHELTDEAQHILNRIADILNQQPGLRLEVAGHTDAQGDPAYNQWLSLKRAEAVRDYMIAQGVNPKNIGAGGYGGQRPIADNSTKDGLRMNRRVELRRLQ